MSERAIYLARYRRMMGNPKHPLHGTATGYRYGCRCGRCSKTKQAANAAYRDRVRMRDARPDLRLRAGMEARRKALFGLDEGWEL